MRIKNGSSKIALGTVILFSLAYFTVQLEPVQDWVLRRAFFSASVNMNSAPKPDALSASVCGSRSPIPDPKRAEACILVEAGERLFVIDTGDGSVARLRQWAIPFNRVESVFITHLHSDHISDLADLHLATWVLQNRPGKLPVYGPRGIQQITDGFELAYGIDYRLRNSHHGDSIAPLTNAGFDAHPIDDNALTLLDEDGLKVTAFLVDHPPVIPAYGYRFEYKGRSLVISGDTKETQAMIDQSRGADVLFHEAQSNEMLNLMINAANEKTLSASAQLFEDIQSYHSTPAEAADIANKADVKHLIYYHLTPAPRNWLMEKRLLRNAIKVRPDDWTVAKDGTRVTLPVGSSEIKLDSR